MLDAFLVLYSRMYILLFLLSDFKLVKLFNIKRTTLITILELFTKS